MLCKTKVVDSSSQEAFIIFKKKKKSIVELHKAGNSSFSYSFENCTIQIIPKWVFESELPSRSIWCP